MKVIIFKKKSGGVGLISFNPKYVPDIAEGAKTHVPKGQPYKIVEHTVLPEDQTFFDAWEADFSSPDGYGEATNVSY